MFAEIITIGDEILIGQIVDTNSAFIGTELNKIGVSVYQITSIQDSKPHILQALKDASVRADIVIITGGLGPTKDDITKHALCEYFNDSLVESKEVLEHVTALFKKYTSEPLSEINRMQALVPSSAEVLFNEKGTAPGMWIKDGDTVFVSLPGVPFEMKHLIATKVIPKIIKQFKRPFILHKTIVTYGVGESFLANIILDWEEQLPNFIKLAYLPSLGTVRLRLSAKGENQQEVESGVSEQVQKLKLILGDIVYGEEGDDAIEVVLADLLKHKGMTLSTAESCTGGKIAEQITTVPGASAYFKGSVVSYATETKVDVLNVPEALIQEHSVVSAKVAEAMAVNVKSLLKTDFAIATTGNAGPTKGDSDAEIGTVYIAIASPKGVTATKFLLGSQRERIVQKAVNKSFELLHSVVLES